MKLFIAEKPSLARAIVSVLPKPHHKEKGCVYVGHTDKSKCDVVSWCIGHILEQAEPEAYDSLLKKWSIATLPIQPDTYPSGWKLVPKRQTREQFKLLKTLIKQATCIVHCGDPDREGQLLVDELIHYVGIKSDVKQSIQRCLINDMNPKAVKQAIEHLKDNKDFSSLSISALARSRADWLYGINMTRCCTLHGQSNNYKGVLSIGRVQTPVLGLVVQRDIDIEQFQPKDYVEIDAHIQIDENLVLRARWQPSEACHPYMDEEGRVLSKALAENVIQRIQNQPAKLTRIESKQKKQAAPLPYNLSALQIDAAKQFGFNAKSVLDACQSLYEQHKLITYPRSDNRYLPEGHFLQAKSVIQAISQHETLKPCCRLTNTSLKSKAWNDKKVGAHHAIIPTEKTYKKGQLSHIEEKLYQLISKQYLSQFFPAWVYQDSQVDFIISGGLFRSKERITLELGWKMVFEDTKKEIPSHSSFASLVEGHSYLCIQGELLSKQTQPPQAFTDATLLAAMTGIARFVKDPTIKQVLKETDGLGTEATRAGIIELLFKRQFLERNQKQIRATPAGKALILSLPQDMSSPDMTAHWESKLNAICQSELSYEEFMSPLKLSLNEYISSLSAQNFDGLSHIKSSFRGSKKTKPPSRYIAKKKQQSKTTSV